MKRTTSIQTILALCSAATLAISASANTYTVPGTSDPWLANAIIDNIGTPEAPDTAPGQSPILAGLVSPGSTITWSAFGEVGHPGDIAGPDGAFLISRYMGGNNGIPDLTAPIDGLIGVWAFPGGGTPFFMGSSGSAVVPAGATELFLGTMDGYGWANNTGAFTVDINGVPDAGCSAGLLAMGLGLLAFYRKQQRA